MKTLKKRKAKPMSTIHKMRLVVGCTLVGSVVAGAAFGWFDTPVDPRALGAGLGALAGILTTFHLA